METPSCFFFVLYCIVWTCFYYCGQYELRLAASDNLKENYTTVVIHVKDVNDNPPVFERPTYRTQITEEDDRNLPKRVLQVPSSPSSYICVFCLAARRMMSPALSYNCCSLTLNQVSIFFFSYLGLISKILKKVLGLLSKIKAIAFAVKECFLGLTSKILKKF